MRKLIVAGLTSGLLGALLPIAPLSSPAAALPAGKVATPTSQAPDAPRHGGDTRFQADKSPSLASSVGAHSRDDRYTPFSRDFIRPDGKHERLVSTTPRYYQASDGSWHSIDLALVGDKDGYFRAQGTQNIVRLADHAGGGVVQSEVGAGAIVLSHPGASDAPGRSDAAHGRVDYAGSLSGGRGLLELLTTSGFEEDVSLATRNAGASYVDEFQMPPGISAHQVTNGVQFRDAKGNLAMQLFDGLAHDAKTKAGPYPEGLGAETPVTVTLASTTAQTATVTVSISPSWLDSPARVFPVDIDPDSSSFSAYLDDSYVNSDNCAGTYSTQSELRVGSPGIDAEACADPLFPNYNQPNQTSRTRTVMQFPLDNLVGSPYAGHTSFTSATVQLYDYQSGTGGAVSNEELELYGLAGPISSATDWGNQPAPDNGYNYTSTTNVANPGYYQWDIVNLATRWVDGGEANNGVEIRSNPSGVNNNPSAYDNEYDSTGDSFRRFYSQDFADASGEYYVAPTLDLVYYTVPGMAYPVTASSLPGAASVSWSPPDTGGTAITNYTVTAYDQTASTSVSQTCSACVTSSPSYTFNNLVIGDSYYFTVTATNAQGSGSPSNQSNSITIAKTVPDPPTGLGATSQPGAGAYLTWSPPAPNGSAITSYTAIAYDLTKNASTAQSCTACVNSSPSYSFVGLVYNDNYDFRVYATNSYGNGNLSAPSNQVAALSAISMTKGFGSLGSGGSVNCSAPDTTSPVTFGRGTQVPYCLSVTNQSSAPVTINSGSLVESLSLALSGAGAKVTSAGSTCSANPDPCSITNNALAVPSFTLNPGATETFGFAPVAVGGDRGCSPVANAGSVTSTNGGASASAPSASICDTGLGVESWWSYVTSTLGPQASAKVNVANGNLVVQQGDSTPVQAHGHLAYALTRTYNSQDSNLVSFPGSFGTGWLLNIDQSGAAASAGVGATGLYVPSGQGVANPMAVTLIDRDGTRHLFTPRALGGVLDLTTPPSTGVLASVVPRVLKLDAGYTNLCVDQTYSAPAGVHLGLWRYVEANTACSSLSSASQSAVLGYAAERPDRLRYEFSSDGHLLDMVDASGVDLHYAYDQAPTAGASLTTLRSVYETRAVDSSGNAFSCSASVASCRAFRFAYSTDTNTTCPPDHFGNAICVTDPAGRLTRYVLDANPRTLGVTAHLLGVYNPDNPWNASVASPNPPSVSYTYGSCAGSGPNQLCSVRDPRGGLTTFSYTSAPQGPARLATISDRRANATNPGDANGSVDTFTYNDASGYVTSDVGPKATPCGGDPACERQRFASIDNIGRVGEIDAGYPANSTSDVYLSRSFYTWDSSGATCRQPDQVVDNNLCKLVRQALNDSETGQHNGITTPDEITTWVYNAEGKTLSQARTTGSTTLYTTSGYHAQYIEASGSLTTCGATSVPVNCYDDTVAGGGNVTSGGPTSGRADANTLYALSDRTQSLTPTGNAAGSGYSAFLTTFEPDDSASASPNAVPSATVCATPGSPTADTGEVCETDSPAPTGAASPPATSPARCSPAATHASPYACVTYTYDSFGQKLSMTSAKANAETPAASTPPATAYTYYADTSSCSSDPTDCDLSGSVTAGGWLRAVSDPTANFVAYGYDAAGNQVRTWDRNATAGSLPSAYPGTLTAPTNCSYSETLYAPSSVYGSCPPSNLSAQPYAKPWRYAVTKRNQLGETITNTVDANGNTTTIRSARGNAANSSAYDVTAVFDAGDEMVSHTLPLGASGTSGGATTTYSYDPFGNRTSSVDPNTKVRAYRHDSINRLTETDWTRGPSGTAIPSGCKTATGADSPIPSGSVECSTLETFDGIDNQVTTQDANHHTTTYTYDGIHRQLTKVVPRNDLSLSTVETATNYDADSNVVDSCSPREFTEGSRACTASSVFGTHHTYDASDRVISTTTYRAAGLAQTQSLAYDADGNQITATDANGHQTTWTYDLLDRKATMAVPRDATHAYTTVWAYDPAGDVTSTIRPGSLNTGTGAAGALVVDGSVGANSTDGVAHPQSNPYLISGTPNFTTVTLQNGGWISAPPYNGGSGTGSLQFSATGTVSICSNCGLSVAGLGSTGGAGGSALTTSGANGAGPGAGLGGASAAVDGGGGGGAGHFGAGASGLSANTGGGAAGTGGAAYGAADLSDAQDQTGLGSGGGGGGWGANTSGGSGGGGGGFIHVTAESINVQGQISANASNGGNASSSLAGHGGGGGGGGSGGTLWLSATTVTLAGSGLSDSGGSGGSGTNANESGGQGAPGLVRVDADVLSGGSVGAGGFLRRYAGRVTAYSYDPVHRLLDTVGAADSTTAAQAGPPDARGGMNVRTRKVYDADGNIVAVFGPRAFVSSVTSPNSDFMLSTDFDVDGRPTASYVPRYDNSVSSASDLGSSLDPNNTQGAQCRLTNRPAPVYGPTPPPAYGSQTGVCLTATTYDAAGNRASLILPTAPGSGSTNRHVDYTYTDDNLVASVSAPDPSHNGARVTAQVTTYDADGKPLKVTDALGDAKTTSYFDDETTKQVTAQPYASVTHVTTYAYDANGNATKVTDGVGAVTATAYFADDRRSRVTDGAGDVTSYTYDPVGNPTQVVSPSANAKDATNPSGTPTVNTYSFDNLVLSTTVPVAPDSTASVRRETTYAYDRAGRKTAQDVLETNATGTPLPGQDSGAQSFTYADDDRLTAQTGHNGSGRISYTYDAAGNKTAVTDSTSGLSVASTYYLDDSVRSVNDGSGRMTQYAYDGAMTKVARADAVTSSGTRYPTTYVYGDAETLASMAWTDPGAPSGATTFSYDAGGRLATQADPNGATTTYTFNPDDTLAAQAQAKSGTTLASWSYTYDNNARELNQTFSGQPAAGGTGLDTAQYSYAYDPAGRLSSFTDRAGTRTISYDHDSNRTAFGVAADSYVPPLTTPPTPKAQGFVYNADDSIQSANGATFAYDAFGGVVSDGTRVDCYDGFDRLIDSSANPLSHACAVDTSTTTFTYDGLDRQRSHTDPAPGGTVPLHYDGLSSQVSIETAPTTNLVTAYQLDPAGTPKEANQQGAVGNPTTQFLATDGQGNITTGVDATGAVACTARFDPYGDAEGAGSSPPCNTGSSPNSAWYRSVHMDPTTSTYQLGSRTYDPTKAGFLTPDSYRSGSPDQNPSIGVDPLTRNTYTYVNGDPVNLVDPNGHVSRRFCEANGASAGACDVINFIGGAATPSERRSATYDLVERARHALLVASAVAAYTDQDRHLELTAEFLQSHKWEVIGGTVALDVLVSLGTTCVVLTGGVCANIGVTAGAIVGPSAAELWSKEAADLAAEPVMAPRVVIGGMEDLGPGSIGSGEETLASRLPGNTGDRLGNWLNNRDVLRQAIDEGNPIRDASVDSEGNLRLEDTRRFITMERDYMRSFGWTYDPGASLWMPPG